MDKLLRGIQQFQANVFESKRSLFEKLGGGQAPEVLFITCSDSRIDPALLTQTEPGDMFVVRNAGNIVPPAGTAHSGELATIEYAVSELPIRDIVVCGHTQCGAMKGLLALDQLDAMPGVKSWLDYAQATLQILRTKHAGATGSELLSAAIQENVLVQLANLRTHPAVAAKVASGEINLHGWVYQFESGDVFRFSPEEHHFVSLRGAAKNLA